MALFESLNHFNLNDKERNKEDMDMRKIGLLIIVGVLSLGIAGCVGNGKYNKDMNLLRSQLELIQSDVNNLRTSQTKVEETLLDSATAGKGTGVAAVGATGEVYRTPSGFTLASRDIQNALKNSGYYTGPIDGKIGSRTKTAIKRFQEDQGLVPDGVCGRNTWAKLQAFIQGASPIK